MSCAIELTVCLSVDFPCNDINEHRLFGTASEGANILHEVGEARWAPAENAFSFLDAVNQVFDLEEREVSKTNSCLGILLPDHDRSRQQLHHRLSTHLAEGADTTDSVLVRLLTTMRLEVLRRHNF